MGLSLAGLVIVVRLLGVIHGGYLMERNTEDLQAALDRDGGFLEEHPVDGEEADG